MNYEFLAYQLIILFVAVMLIIRSMVLTIQGKKNFRELMLAILIWGVFAILALFPNLSTFIAHIFGFELGINFILTITTIILFASVLHLIVKTDKNNSEITQLVRQLALKEIKERKQDN